MTRQWFNRAFEASTGVEAPFTQFQLGPYREAQMNTSDYVFYRAGSGVKSILKYLEMANQSELSSTGYPSDNHPSDHFALGFEFVVSKQRFSCGL